MKRPNRALEVFSLSALDLFASAMGAFILIAVVLFPYYLKNQEVVSENKQLKQELGAARQQLQQALSAVQAAQAAAEQARQAAAAAQAEAQRAQREAETLRNRVQALEAEVEKLRQQAQAAEAAGRCQSSRWSYLPGSAFIMYQCKGGGPQEMLLVGIVHQANNTDMQLRVGDTAMVAVRRGRNVSGYWWTWNNSSVNCVYRGIAEEFTGTFSSDGRSMTIRSANGTTEGMGNRCIFTRTRMDTFNINRLD